MEDYAYEIRDALDAIHPRYGHFMHLPQFGGILDQPSVTYEIYRITQQAFRSHLAKEQEKQNRKMKAGR